MKTLSVLFAFYDGDGGGGGDGGESEVIIFPKLKFEVPITFTEQEKRHAWCSFGAIAKYTYVCRKWLSQPPFFASHIHLNI